MNSKSVLILSAALAATVAFADPNAPQITACTVTQDPVTHLVQATYTLDEPAVITFDVRTNGVSIGGANLTHAYGDVHRVVTAGSHTLYWQADKAWQGYRLASDFSVVAWATNAPPDYMVVDLVVKKGERTYYIAPEQLPDGGVTNTKYKTDYLVMRRIPAKDAIFPMGLNNNTSGKFVYHRVMFTNDFYMAVYELTQGQFKNVLNESDWSLSYFSYISSSAADEYRTNLEAPIPQLRYYELRGYGKKWPEDGHEIDTDSRLNTFRTTLNLPTLDLPTEAEWEFACRAGTAGNRYDGTADGTLPTCGWVDGNWPPKAPHSVGLLQPNAFGLYDMIGNVAELCLDLYNEGDAYAEYDPNRTKVPVVAPKGPEVDNGGGTTNRVMRGHGIWETYPIWNANSWYREPKLYSNNYPTFGYRLVCLP